MRANDSEIKEDRIIRFNFPNQTKVERMRGYVSDFKSPSSVNLSNNRDTFYSDYKKNFVVNLRKNYSKRTPTPQRNIYVNCNDDNVRNVTKDRNVNKINLKNKDSQSRRNQRKYRNNSFGKEIDDELKSRNKSMDNYRKVEDCNKDISKSKSKEKLYNYFKGSRPNTGIDQNDKSFKFRRQRFGNERAWAFEEEVTGSHNPDIMVRGAQTPDKVLEYNDDFYSPQRKR